TDRPGDVVSCCRRQRFLFSVAGVGLLHRLRTGDGRAASSVEIDRRLRGPSLPLRARAGSLLREAHEPSRSIHAATNDARRAPAPWSDTIDAAIAKTPRHGQVSSRNRIRHGSVVIEGTLPTRSKSVFTRGMSRRHDTIAHSPLPVTVLRPIKGWVPLRLDELWEYRELLYFLAWRDLNVRYKQTILGGTWALLQAIFTMVVFSVFFGKLAQVPSDGLPYPVFAFAALVPWNFFSNALTQASNSLVLDTSMITKVYFPRLIMPTATVVAGL